MKLAVWASFILVLAPLGASAHGDIDLQIKEATRLISNQPTNAELYLRRGELHRIHQDWDAAQADYDRAASFNPNLGIVDLARGKMFLEAGWPLSAKVALDRFLAGRTNHADGLITRARTLVKLGRRLEAAQDYSEAIAHSAQPQPDTFVERCQALTDEGAAYFAQAVKGLDEGLKRLGPLPVLQRYAIDLELKQKAFDSALARLERVSALSPRKETFLARRGEILVLAGRPSEAQSAYRDALKAMATLPPSRRQVPAMLELEKNIRLALAGLDGIRDKNDEKAPARASVNPETLGK